MIEKVGEKLFVNVMLIRIFNLENALSLLY